MTPDSDADDPADSSGEESPAIVDPQNGGDGGSAAPVDGGGLLPALKAKRSQKRALKKEMKEQLGQWSFFSTYDPGEAIRLVVNGDQIGTRSGDGEAIGLMIVRLSKLFSTLGGRPQLESLAFGNSVTIDFRAPEAEAKRAKENLDEAEKLLEAAGAAPSPEQADEINLALRGALTDMVVAAELASELVSVPSDEAPAVAVAFGGDVAGAYKTLANAVVQAQVTLTIEAPAREPTKLTPAKATRVAEELRASNEPLELTITAFGTLALANQEQRGFGLRLDRDATRHAILKGKRVINGTYLPEVEAEIRDQGLWGREVRATLRVVRDALISTSAVRPATFTLIAVEPRHKAES
jgi:hypothetical protein